MNSGTWFFVGFFLCALGFAWADWPGWLIGMLLGLILVCIDALFEVRETSGSSMTQKTDNVPGGRE